MVATSQEAQNSTYYQALEFAGVPRADSGASLREQQVHRVLVTEKGKLCGLVSAFDLMALLED